MHYNHCHRATTHLQLNFIIIVIIIIIIIVVINSLPQEIQSAYYKYTTTQGNLSYYITWLMASVV